MPKQWSEIEIRQPEQSANLERVLVAKAKGGDPAAFKELFHLYGGRILRFAIHITRNREDAEDVVQESFLKAYLHLDSFRGESQFYTWLVRITTNEALGKWRRLKRAPFPVDEPFEPGGQSVMSRIEDERPTPEEQCAENELRAIATQAISQLDPRLRIVFQLRDVEQISSREAAGMLGITIPAVKSRLIRARQKLRRSVNYRFRRISSPPRQDGSPVESFYGVARPAAG